MGFPPRFLDELRERLDLAGVIGKHVKLTRRGREYVGLSPFKAEKTPSFTVVPEKGFYHDFASGEHGDIIDFVMKVEGLSFPEAVEKLASDAGMDVPRDTPEERARAKRRADLFDVLELATRFFERQLRMPEGKKALDYLLTGRGLAEETIERFRLGYAPDHPQSLRNELAREKITEDRMIAGGLRKRAEDGRGFDYFRGRVMFPIADKRGRVLGFGARIMGDGRPKYLNSPETPLFHKGRVLYGLHQAVKPAMDAGRLLVAEGYMDVVALAQAGFPHAVAPLGTALTEEQIARAWNLCNEPILCFDGDVAGARAAMRVAEKVLPLLKPGHSLRFAALPEGEDPDSLVGKFGKAGMESAIEEALPLSEIVWRHETRGKPVSEPEARAALDRRLDDHVRRIGDAMVRKHFSQAFKDRLLRSSGVPPRRVPRSGPSPTGAIAAARGPATKVDAASREARVMLALLIRHPGFFADVEDDIGMLAFEDSALEDLRQALVSVLSEEASVETDALLERLRTRGLERILDVLIQDDLVRLHWNRSLGPDADRADLAALWAECLKNLRSGDVSRDPLGVVASEEEWARHSAHKRAEFGDE